MAIFFTLLKIVPSAGPINGIQNRTTIMSGFSFLSWLPTFIQLNGFIEFIIDRIPNPSGAGSFVYCDLPGKNIDGYCREKEQMLHSCPVAMNSLASRWLNVANPPRNGWPGPMIMILLIKTRLSFQ